MVCALYIPLIIVIDGIYKPFWSCGTTLGLSAHASCSESSSADFSLSSVFGIFTVLVLIAGARACVYVCVCVRACVHACVCVRARHDAR